MHQSRILGPFEAPENGTLSATAHAPLVALLTLRFEIWTPGLVGSAPEFMLRLVASSKFQGPPKKVEMSGML